MEFNTVDVRLGDYLIALFVDKYGTDWISELQKFSQTFTGQCASRGVPTAKASDSYAWHWMPGVREMME